MRPDRYTVIEKMGNSAILQGKLIPENAQEKNLLERAVEANYTDEEIEYLTNLIIFSISPYTPLGGVIFRKNGIFTIEAIK